MMAGIRNKNTKPEMQIRKGLHALGFRYSLHKKSLPGKPDLVLSKYKAVIFVNGCFWHGHDCPLFRLPSTRPEFWGPKINRNRENDIRAETQLLEKGWRIAKIWECALRGRHKRGLPEVINILENWLSSKSAHLEIRDKL